MLKKDDITKIASLLKMDESALTKALSETTEVDITIPDIQVFSADELKTRDEKMKKTSYGEGKNIAIEMFVKEQREKGGYDFEGKDPDKLIEAIKTKTLLDAKIEPNRKISEQEEIIKKLQTSVKTIEDEKKALQNEINTAKTDSKLLGMLPKERLSTLNDNEYLFLIKNELQFEEVDGKSVVKKGGEILRDEKTQDPITPEAAIAGIFTNRKWVGEQEGGKGGRGSGGDQGKQGVFLKFSEFEKNWKDQGKSPNSSEFSAAVEAARKANPSFDMDA